MSYKSIEDRRACNRRSKAKSREGLYALGLDTRLRRVTEIKPP